MQPNYFLFFFVKRSYIYTFSISHKSCDKSNKHGTRISYHILSYKCLPISCKYLENFSIDSTWKVAGKNRRWLTTRALKTKYRKIYIFLRTDRYLVHDMSIENAYYIAVKKFYVPVFCKSLINDFKLRILWPTLWN